MKKEIKLTQKQEQVLRRYNELLAKHDYQPVWVDTAYVDMTALNKIVGANWFDRTFEALVQKGLLVKVEQEKIVEEGYFTGKNYTDWYWKLTDLGLEYLGIDTPKDEKEINKVRIEAGRLLLTNCMVDLEEGKLVVNQYIGEVKRIDNPQTLIDQLDPTLADSEVERISNNIKRAFKMIAEFNGDEPEPTVVTPKEEQKVLEVIAQVGNGRPVDMEGIVKFSGYGKNRIEQIISDLVKKGLVEEGIFNDLFIEQDFYLSKLGDKYLTGELDINDSLNKEDVLEAILEVENDKAYEQDDKVTLQVDDVYYNLKFYDTLKGNKSEVMPLLINAIRFLAQDGFIEILENTKDDITFKATIEGYLYYKEARPEESIQTQILKVVNLATELFLGIKVDDNNQLHLWDYEKQKIVDDYDLPILYMTSREFDRQQDNKLEELKKRLQHVNTLLYNKVVQ